MLVRNMTSAAHAHTSFDLYITVDCHLELFLVEELLLQMQPYTAQLEQQMVYGTRCLHLWRRWKILKTWPFAETACQHAWKSPACIMNHAIALNNLCLDKGAH